MESRILAVIERAEAALTSAARPEDLAQAICDAITQGDLFPLAWIGLAENDPGKSVLIVGASGSAVGYVERTQFSWDDSSSGLGPCGRCIRLGQTIVNQNAAGNPAFRRWLGEAGRYGLASSIALPLLDGSKAFGALSVYADRPAAFTPEDIAMFERLAARLAKVIPAKPIQAADRRKEKLTQSNT